MTHGGPLQPLLFCDSVIGFGQLNQISPHVALKQAKLQESHPHV